ncbi:MAG: hypothetical protein JWM44_1574 [Bacilli bacterium]|nr:hypothetical protein [Bacilli bacterium]
MSRDLPVGNGSVLVNFDMVYNIRDLYFPYVGQENQGSGYPSHFGVWTPKGFFGIDDPEAHKEGGYLNDTLVTNVEISHERLGISLNMRDTVDIQENVFVRKAKVENHHKQPRHIKLYFHLNLDLYGNGVGDTIFYNPDLRSLVF